MKRAIMLVLMLMILCGVNSYAGLLDWLCCCSGSGDVEELQLFYEPLGVKWIASFEDFKKYYTADGTCEMRMGMTYGSLMIVDQLKAGRGQKTLVR